MQDRDIPPPVSKYDHKNRRQPAGAQIIFQHAYAFAHPREQDLQNDYRMQAQNAPHNSRLVFANDLTVHGLMPSQKVLLYAYACAMVWLYGDTTSQQALTQMEVTPGNNRRGQENSSERTVHDISTGHGSRSDDDADPGDRDGAGDQGASDIRRHVGGTATAYDRACMVVGSFRNALNSHLVLPNVEPLDKRIMRWRSGVIHDPDVTSPHPGDVI